MIYARILCDSLNAVTKDRLTTLECEYPLYLHNELLTHRSMSRNSASSRAIPVAKRLERVANDPVIPIVWPKNQAGMSAVENLSGEEARIAESFWKSAALTAVASAKQVADAGVHKQIANRIVEPWVWMKTIISATEWENFFALRCAKDAHPDLQELAFHMLEAIVTSKPQSLMPGEWHIPFGDRLAGLPLEKALKVCVARCARISYLTPEGQFSFEKDLELYERLLSSRHMSAFEHCAQASSVPDCEYPEEFDWSAMSNFSGFKQYRKTIDGETRTCDMVALYNQLRAERDDKP